MSNRLSRRAFTKSIADLDTSQTLLDENPARLGASIYNDSTAVLYLKLGESLTIESSSSITYQHDATAATVGVALYVVVDQIDPLGDGYNIGHLAFVSPTNTNGSARLKTGTNAFVEIRDDDNAAAHGYTISAQAAGAGLEALMQGSNPTLIPIFDDTTFKTLTGKWVYLANPTSFTAGGALLYFDEDATNDYEKIMGNIVDTADETDKAYSFDATASSTSFTVEMAAEALYEIPFNYTGVVTGIWASNAAGSARITELT